MPRLAPHFLLLMAVGCGISPEEKSHVPHENASPSKPGGDASDKPENGGAGEPKHETQFQVTPAGCDTLIDLPESHADGVSISIPPGALTNTETVTFSAIRKRTAIKAGTPLGIVYTLTTNGQSTFEEPVSIGVPLPLEYQNDLVVAYQIDENGKLHLMNAATEGDSAKSVVISTWKACSFTLVVVDSL